MVGMRMAERSAVEVAYYRITSGLRRQASSRQYTEQELSRWWAFLLSGEAQVPGRPGWSVRGFWDAQLAYIEVLDAVGAVSGLQVCLDAHVTEDVWAGAMSVYDALGRLGGVDLPVPDRAMLDLDSPPWATSLVNPKVGISDGEALWLMDMEISLAAAVALAAGPGLPGHPVVPATRKIDRSTLLLCAG